MTDRMTERATATFVPYYWEAYNEIVEPRRFDHYLLRKWARDLGPLGFLLVKLLRDRCYHNPTTGVLRDACEISLADLAAAAGVSVPTVVRELRDNAALGHFVQKIRQFRMVDGRPRQDANAYRVSMDDPIHPDDVERYDDLRAAREIERAAPIPTHVVKGKKAAAPYGDQNDNHRGSYDDQNDHPNTLDQNDHADTKCLADQNDHAIGKSLPSGGSLTKESLTPAAAVPQPNGLPPGGEGEGNEFTAAWRAALVSLAEQLSKPTYHAHVATLRPIELTEEGEAVLLVPSAFTREWLEKRHAAAIAAALSEALGRPVTVRLTQVAPAKGAS